MTFLSVSRLYLARSSRQGIPKELIVKQLDSIKTDLEKYKKEWIQQVSSIVQVHAWVYLQTAASIEVS